MIIGCVAINRIPIDKVYIKYKIVVPSIKISILINFLFKTKYHLINLLLKKFMNLSMLIYMNILNIKTIIKPIISIDKINNKILKS